MKRLLSPLLIFGIVAVCCGQTTPKYDRYGGVTSITGTKTGWFHVEEIGGRWFFVTPQGHAFFSLGATHAIECIRQDELNLFETKYGKSEERLAEFFLAKFKEWGYNSSGYGPLPTMEKRIPYVATIWTEGPRSFSAGETSRYTDIFDSAVQERLRQTVRRAAARHIDNPYCLGYVFKDLPVWHPKPKRGKSYCDFIRSLDADSPGRRAYDDFVMQRRAEGTSRDDEAFLNHIAAVYYACAVEELRRCDPHHLLLGDRFMALPERTPDSILVTAAKYVDVISFQPMGTRTPLRKYLDHVYGITGKPVLLADTNTMTQRPQKDQVDTAEYERSAGEHTLEYYLDAASSKACIGIHRCTVRDYQPWNTKYHRRGLLKADDTPYPILVDYTQRTNKQVYETGYGREVETDSYNTPITSADTAHTYYIDARNGDDANDGISDGTAWRSLARVGQVRLCAGDRVLLKRGETFEGPLLIENAMGTEDSPIVVDAYGDGHEPVIDASRTPPGVRIRLSRFVEIHNLEIVSDGGKANSSSPMRSGVRIEADAPGACGDIRLADLYIHDVFNKVAGDGKGIHVVEADQWYALKGVSVERCRIERTASLGMMIEKADGVTVTDNGLKHTGGPGCVYKHSRNIRICGNEVDASGSQADPRMRGRGSCMWMIGCQDAVVEHNRFLRAWGINDSCGFHIDIGNRNVVVQYNLSAENAGGFVEILGRNENCAYRYNISVNDGWRVAGEREAVRDGHVLWATGFTVNKGRIGPKNSYIYNNTIYVKEGIHASFAFGKTVDGLLIGNNIFYILGRPVDESARDWRKDPPDAAIRRVVFRNNLYLRENALPASLSIQDSRPLIGDPKFADPGSLVPDAYIPHNVSLVADQGVPIEKLPGDEIGLNGGLQVKQDIFGNPVVGAPDLGAVEVQQK
jgi:hypothetical protein